MRRTSIGQVDKYGTGWWTGHICRMQTSTFAGPAGPAAAGAIAHFVYVLSQLKSAHTMGQQGHEWEAAYYV